MKTKNLTTIFRRLPKLTKKENKLKLEFIAIYRLTGKKPTKFVVLKKNV